MHDREPDARQLALEMMTAVTEGKEQLLGMDQAGSTSDPAIRARGRRLATEALRWSNRADRLTGPFLRNKPEDLVLNAMRLAIYEIRVAGAPAHGAVNAAVSMVPRQKKGLINAVLRNVERTGSDWDSLPYPVLPKWLRKRLVAAWGKADVSEIEVAHSRVPPVDITVKSEPEFWAKSLEGKVLPTGSIRLEEPGQITKLPGFSDGQWWVQDAGAALAVKVLGPKPGERVLDLCAAPGGKTMQLAAAGAEVTALDDSQARLSRLKENLSRTKLAVELVEADARSWLSDMPFDAVLLDPPCTATGTLRRHPDLSFVKDGSELDSLLPLQSKMLDQAWSLLKPGGRMVFCTCSLLPDEGEMQIDAFLSRTEDASVIDVLPEGVPSDWKSANGGLRLKPNFWPELGGIDGFFITSLQKKH